jgi:hypothetical protein
MADAFAVIIVGLIATDGRRFMLLHTPRANRDPPTPRATRFAAGLRRRDAFLVPAYVALSSSFFNDPLSG